MKFSDSLYSILKWGCLIFLPALIAFLTAVLPIWGVDGGVVNVTVGTLAAVQAFIGALIGVSTVAYNAENK